MKAGISTATLFLKEYVEEALARFAEWKIACTEVFLTSYSEYEPSFAQTLLPYLGKTPVHSVHVLSTQFEPQLYNAHPRVSGDSLAWLNQAMQSAQILGATHYTFHGIARIKRTFQENFERVGKRTQAIFDECQKYGVTLCQENVEWAFYNRPGVFTELKKYCPGLKGVLDIKQARITGYSYEEYLREMGENIAHVHVSDIDEQGKMCLPGRGTFDFQTFIKQLRDVGFDGPLLIENYQSDYEDFLQLRDSYEYLADLCEKLS